MAYFARLGEGLVESLLEAVDFVLSLVVGLLRLLLLQLQLAKGVLTAFELLAQLLDVGAGLVALGVQPRHRALAALVLLLPQTNASLTIHRAQQCVRFAPS